MNSGPRRILFVSQDAGGFNAVFPVYKKLKQESPESISGLFGDVAKKFTADGHVPFVQAASITRKDLERLFDAERPDLLVVGTSSGVSIDKLATDIARKQGIPSVAIIDYWSNYALRFSDPDTKNLAYLPDHILVMDEISKHEMAAEGFDEGRIVVTGNPAFDAFAQPLAEPNGEGIISFVSQPFSELKKDGSGIDYGYDEREVFSDLLDALERLQVSTELVVKHHPRTQDVSVFDARIAASPLRIRTDLETPTDQILAQSVLVLGMSTMALFEAALRGKRVLSYQPHLTIQDPLVSNRLGLSVPVYEKSELVPALKALLAGPPPPALEEARRTYAHGRATQNVVNFLQSL